MNNSFIINVLLDIRAQSVLSSCKCAFIGCLIRGYGGVLCLSGVLSGSEQIRMLEDDCIGLWWGFLVT